MGQTFPEYSTYTGTYKLTGKTFTARVAHVWKFNEGRIMKFEQFVDSQPVNDVMNVNDVIK